MRRHRAVLHLLLGCFKNPGETSTIEATHRLRQTDADTANAGRRMRWELLHPAAVANRRWAVRNSEAGMANARRLAAYQERRAAYAGLGLLENS